MGLYRYNSAEHLATLIAVMYGDTPAEIQETLEHYRGRGFSIPQIADDGFEQLERVDISIMAPCSFANLGFDIAVAPDCMFWVEMKAYPSFRRDVLALERRQRGGLYKMRHDHSRYLYVPGRIASALQNIDFKEYDLMYTSEFIPFSLCGDPGDGIRDISGRKIV
jgi:hypothetical protein